MRSTADPAARRRARAGAIAVQSARMNPNNERGFSAFDVILILVMVFLLFGISLLIAAS